MPTDNPQQLKKLLELVRQAVAKDNELREKYAVEQKFRFIQDRLRELLERLEKKVEVVVVAEDKAKNRVSEDEQLVYVYLYNAQGLLLHSWENMLTPKVFYEYSVNRPIYAEKSSIENLVRSKPNKAQHAFLTMIIKREHLIRLAEENKNKDALGNTLVRVKEGSLHFQNLLLFTHNENDYVLNTEGELVKKADD